MVVGGRHAGSLSPRYKRFFVASTPAARFFVVTATNFPSGAATNFRSYTLLCARNYKHVRAFLPSFLAGQRKLV